MSEECKRKRGKLIKTGEKEDKEKNTFHCFNLAKIIFSLNDMRWWCETAKTQTLLIELAIYWYVTLYTRCAWPSYFFQECSNINVRSGVRILIVCLKVWISIWIWNGWFTNSHFKDLWVQKYVQYKVHIFIIYID